MSDDECCPNCGVDPSQYDEETSVGHSYTETWDGIAYDIDHLAGLGMVEENGIRLLFDRRNDKLRVERIDDEPSTVTHEDLVDRAEHILSATKATMYYPVAHGEAKRLQSMIEQRYDIETPTDND